MNILLVEDHPVVRKGLKTILESEGFFKIIGEADEGNKALKILADSNVDFLIIDINLKGNINGIELVEAVKDRYPNIPMLVMSMSDVSIYAERSLKAGARGFIAKDEAAENIIDAVREIIGGKIYLSKESSTKIAMKHIFGCSTGSNSLNIDILSNRELEIFKLIGKGYKRSELADELNININTIESHRRKIREKLNLKSSKDLTKLAVEWTSNN